MFPSFRLADAALGKGGRGIRVGDLHIFLLIGQSNMAGRPDRKHGRRRRCAVVYGVWLGVIDQSVNRYSLWVIRLQTGAGLHCP